MYIPDFFVVYENKHGKKLAEVVEIKPKKQTEPPKPRSKTTKSYINEVYTYATNQAKWAAAEEFCKDHMIEFKIITEEELGIK